MARFEASNIFLLVVVTGAALAWAAGRESADVPAYVFTAAPRYEPQAWLAGRDRFPAGAAVTLASGRSLRPLAPGFLASADPAVGFGGRTVLFAGRRTASERWRVWEVALDGGAPRAITSGNSDCIRPLYLPGGRIAYTSLRQDGSEIAVSPAAGGMPARLTFAPGRYLAADVLRDGRILFESAGELFTVYPDGTGVESLRCDHGPVRSAARQVASGDVIFSVGSRLARFRSALASQADVAQPEGEIAGPVAEIEAGKWIVSLRRKPSDPFRLILWTEAGGSVSELQLPKGMNAVQPAAVAPRTPPRDFPSALVPTRKNGNLLCLNARDSKTPVPEGARAVRVYTRSNGNEPLLLGQADVERDGSFYVEVPADRPIRLELVDASGKPVRAEKNWFWMRPSEQRICVGCHVGPERSPENKVPEVLLRSTVPAKLLGHMGSTR
jgi:hypothetical protein